METVTIGAKPPSFDNFPSQFVEDEYGDETEVSLIHSSGNKSVLMESGNMIFTPDQARELAAALIKAAEVCE